MESLILSGGTFPDNFIRENISERRIYIYIYIYIYIPDGSIPGAGTMSFCPLHGQARLGSRISPRIHGCTSLR
jgi:hypothetical protein